MELPSIPTYFVCKLCNNSYGKLEQFWEHKREIHFEDFEKLTCIVFKEATLDAVAVNCGLGDKLPATSSNICADNDARVTACNFESASVNHEFSDEENLGIGRLQPDNCKELTITNSTNTNHSPHLQQRADIQIKTETTSILHKQNNAEHSSTSIAIPGFNLESEMEDESDDFFPQSNYLFTQEWQEWNPHQEDRPNLFLDSIEDDEDLIDIIDETNDNSVDTDNTKPVVRLQRLSSNELQSATNFHEIDSNLHPSEIEFEEDGSSSTPFDSSFVPETLIQFKCPYCSKTFNTGPLHKIHVGICALYNNERIKNEEGEENMEVKEVEESNANLNSSQGQFLEEFACSHPGCSRIFEKKRYLKRHWERMHSRDNPHRCPVENCGKTFAVPYLLKDHMIDTHGKEEKGRQAPYKCRECGMVFSRKKYLLRHEAVHGDDVFKCSVDGCLAIFKSMSGLNGHRRVHTTKV